VKEKLALVLCATLFALFCLSKFGASLIPAQALESIGNSHTSTSELTHSLPVTASIPVLVPYTYMGLPVQPPRTSIQTTASIAGTGAISGTVTAAETGDPLVGAGVEIFRIQGGVPQYLTSTVTISNGTYRMAGLDGGDYTVQVKADGYTAEWYLDAVNCQYEATTIVVLNDHTIGPVDFALDPGSVITGHVYADDGTTPIAGATVLAWTADRPMRCRLQALTDASGAYRIPNVPPGPCYVGAMADAYAPEIYQEGTLIANATVVTATAGLTVTGINFTLDHGGTIRGHVYAEDGVTPLEGANVGVLALHPELMERRDGYPGTATAPDGSYLLEHLPFGNRYTVLAYYTVPPYPAWQYYHLSPDISRATPVTVTKTYTPTDIDFALGPSGGITGHVYAADGITPFPHDGTVFATSFYSSPLGVGWGIGSDGSYRMDRFLPTDDYLVGAHYPGYVSNYYDNATVRAAATPVSVTAQYTTPHIDFALEAYWPLDIGNRWVYRWHNSAAATTITETVKLVAQEGDRYTLMVNSPYDDGWADVGWQSNGLHWWGCSIVGYEGAPEWRSVLEYTFMPTRFLYFKPAEGGDIWRPFGARWAQRGEYFSSYFARSAIAPAPEMVQVSGTNHDDALRITTVITSSDAHLAGSRTMWFVPDVGLVKFIYQHGDGQMTTAELVGLHKSVVLQPDTESTLIYTDAQGSTTTIEIPAGAVTETTTLAYTPVETTTVPSGFSFAGHAFTLDVYRSGTLLLPGFTFNIPVTVTIHYTDDDVAGLDETSLVLGHWNEVAGLWEDAACEPYDRHPGENWLAVPICHLSRFALFGERYTAYLPVVLKGR
jgi:hypothetical protein